MAKNLERELENLKRKIMAIAGLVEERLASAMRALERKDRNLAQEVIERDVDINAMEVTIEEECLKVLALHQPVAIDLRLIVAILKINNDIERIGDLAVNIAERALVIAQYESQEIQFDFKAMAGKTMKMFENSLIALVNLNPRLAREVCEADDEIDEMNREMFRFVLEQFKQCTGVPEVLLNYMLAARHLERIADHATNIAEDVIYMVEGEIVRHRLGELPKDF